MSCDGTLVEAPPSQHNNNNNNTEPHIPLQPKIVHAQVSGGLGSTTLNPEASVFQLPAPRQHSPPATPSQPTTHINGFTHHVYPFMNGDVGKQYCGVCPPTPDTPRSLAVDAPLDSALVTSSVPSTPLNSSAKSLAASSSVFATPPSDMASSSSPVSSNDPQDTSKEVLLAMPIVTCQQNGELEFETTDLSTNTSVTSIPDDTNPINTTTEIDVVTVDDDEVDSGVIAISTSLPPETPSSTETAPATPQTESVQAELEASLTKLSLNDATEETPSSTVPECDGDSQVDAAAGKGEEVGEANNETQGTQTTPAQSPAPNQPAPEPLTRDQIKALVAQQVEFFFSRENLSNDPYLISQMDSDQYVPVFILAGCSQFKSITKDHSIIVEALKESPFVQLDEEKNRVRPNYKRCIVILREIPESTPVEEIEAMFKGEECPKLVSCEFVHNSSWYVTFESDEDAQKAYWYLRGVVKTFKDKPILARIKTKPISRLGCLSVLPSYGGKGPGDAKDQPRPPSTPGPGGSQGGPPAPTPQPGTPATPAPPTSSYNPRAPPYMYPAPPSSVNGPTYSYSYPTATNTMPTAYFYPNMPVWTAPGGFYDINSFLQFNGLSPQAAFKPPPTPHNPGRFNGRRNSKHGRQNDNRQQQNNGGYNGTSGGHSGYHHNQRSHSHSGHSRPQSAQSPSAGPQGHQAHRSGNSSQAATATASAVVSHPQPTATVATTTTTTTTAASVPQQTPSAVSTIPANNHNFAQCDLALASQSNLYTSFSPPMDAAAAAAASPNSSIRTDKKDMVSVKATPQSNSSSNSSNMSSTSSTPPVSTSGPASHTNTNVSPAAASSSSMLNTPTTAAASIAGVVSSSSQTVVTAAMPSTQISSQIPPSQQQLQHQQQLQQQQQYPAGPPPPPHHRNAYNSDYHHHPGPHPHYHHPMQRDQHQRQFYHNWGYPRSRGGRGRRRPREEEEMMGMGPVGRGRGQGPRGPPMQPPGSNDMVNKSQPQQPDSIVPSPQTHFDLEAAAFPPLPGATPDEPIAPVAEERPVEPLPSAWGSSDSQRFSDVMKGTAKPRPQSQPSQTSSPGEPIIEIPSPTNLTTPSSTLSGFSHGAAPTVPGAQAALIPTTPAAAAAVVTPTQVVAPPPTAAAIVATPPTSQSNTEITNSISQDATSPSAAPTTTQQTAASISSSINSNLNSCNSSVNNGVNKVDSRNSQRIVYSRDERRGGAVGGGPRGDRREYPRDIRGPRDHRNIRENIIRGTGKENRPMPSRPWKEDRVDADGWITKGSRSQRDTNRDQLQSQPPQYNQRDKADSREARSSHLVNGDTTPPPSPKPQNVEKTSKDDNTPAAEDQKVSTSQPLNNNDGEHKPSWAMMAKLSKEPMERLSVELKEKEEQEKIKKLRLNTRPQMKPQEYIPQREGKPLRRDGPQRENRQSSERGGCTFRPRDSARPKSPK